MRSEIDMRGAALWLLTHAMHATEPCPSEIDTRAPQRSVLHAMHFGVRRFSSDFLSSACPQRISGLHEAARCGPL